MDDPKAHYLVKPASPGIGKLVHDRIPCVLSAHQVEPVQCDVIIVYGVSTDETLTPLQALHRLPLQLQGVVRNVIPR
jgi:hypothetical protein